MIPKLSALRRNSENILIGLLRSIPHQLQSTLTPTLTPLKWIRGPSFTWCRALESWWSPVFSWHTSKAKVSLAIVCGALWYSFLGSSHENYSRNVTGIRLSAVILSWHIDLTWSVLSFVLGHQCRPVELHTQSNIQTSFLPGRVSSLKFPGDLSLLSMCSGGTELAPPTFMSGTE